MKPRIFLDMDGVIADLVGGFCKARGIQSPYVLDVSLRGPEYYHMPPLLGISNREFWSTMDSREFWAQLGPLPELEVIRSTIESLGLWEQTCVLSSPSSTIVGCLPGKRDWLHVFLREVESRMLFGSCKYFCASPHSVLIDDHDNNVNLFRAHGGHAILVPRPWNTRHAEEESYDLGKELRDTVQSVLS